jgi:hypothetical protein
MRAYVCVYRHTAQNKLPQAVNKLCAKYLKNYPNSFYDWCDDPSFFCSAETGNPVTWGVCRTNVRKNVGKGVIIIYFCARQDPNNKKMWDYYYVGFGVCADTLIGRQARLKIWTQPHKYPFKDYFNILIDSKGNHREYTGDHPDYKKRMKASYVIFDEHRSSFRVDNPLHVAAFDANSSGFQETWINSKKVDALKKVLFTDNGITRGLRIKNRQRAHVHIHIKEAPDDFEDNLRRIT